MTYPNQPPPPNLGSQNTVFVTEVRFDPSYIKTLQGILKVIVFIFSIIIIICIQSTSFRANGRGVFFTFVAVLAFIFSGGLLVLYLYHIVEKYHNIKWLKIELVGCIVLVFLYLTASTIAVAFGSAAYSAAGFFGYLSMTVYGFDAFFKVKGLKAGTLAQGHRVVNKPVHIVTPPALP